MVKDVTDERLESIESQLVSNEEKLDRMVSSIDDLSSSFQVLSATLSKTITDQQGSLSDVVKDAVQLNMTPYNSELKLLVDQMKKWDQLFEPWVKATGMKGSVESGGQSSVEVKASSSNVDPQVGNYPNNDGRSSQLQAISGGFPQASPFQGPLREQHLPGDPTAFNHIPPSAHSSLRDIHRSTGVNQGQNLYHGRQDTPHNDVIVNPQRTCTYYTHPPLRNPRRPLSDGFTEIDTGDSPLKNHMPTPKVFSKNNIANGPGQFRDFLERFESYATLQQISYGQLHSLLHSFLEGEARTFSNQCDPLVRSDYYSLCDKLLSYFDNRQNNFQLRQQLESTKQKNDEPFRQFVTRLRSAALALYGYADSNSVDEAVRYGIMRDSLEHIRNAIQHSERIVCLNRIATEEEIMAFAEAEEDLTRRRKTTQGSIQGTTSQMSSPPRFSSSSRQNRPNNRQYQSNSPQYRDSQFYPPQQSQTYSPQQNQAYPSQQNQFYAAQQNSGSSQYREVQSPVVQQQKPASFQASAPQTQQSSQSPAQAKRRFYCEICGSDRHSTDRHRVTKAEATDRVKNIYLGPKKVQKVQVQAVSTPEVKDENVEVVSLDFGLELGLSCVDTIGTSVDKSWEITLEAPRFKTAGPDLDLNQLRQSHSDDKVVRQIVRTTPHTYVQLEDRKTLALLDTGAAANIVPEKLFLELLETRSEDWAYRHIRNVSVCLHGYGAGEPLNITELVTMKVQVGESVKSIPFLVDRNSKRTALLLGWPALISLLGNVFPSTIPLLDSVPESVTPVVDIPAQLSLNVGPAPIKPVTFTVSAEIPDIGHLYVKSRRQIPPGSAALVSCRAELTSDCDDQPMLNLQNLYLDPVLPSCQLSEGFITLTGSSTCNIVIDNPSGQLIDLRSGDLVGHLSTAEEATAADLLNSVANFVSSDARIDSHLVDVKCTTDVPVSLSSTPVVSQLIAPSPQILKWTADVVTLSSELENIASEALSADCHSSPGPMGLHDWKIMTRASQVKHSLTNSPVPMVSSDNLSSIESSPTVPEATREECLRALMETNIPEIIPPDRRKELISWLVSHHDIFSLSDADLVQCDLLPHIIETGDARPIKIPARRIPPALKPEIARQVATWLEIGVARPSSSPWAAPICYSKKKNGKLRICCDYRALNGVTKKVAWPMNRCDDLLDSLGQSKAKVFTSLDLRSGYMQLLVDENSQEKTAFSCHLGLFEFMRLPFGLCAAPATFQRTMAAVLFGLPVDNVLFYLDDILVATDTIERNMQIQEDIFERLRKYGLKLNPEKCEFFRSDLEFLGFKVSDKGLETMPYKIAAVQTFPAPKNLKQLRRFLGMSSYYRRFIPGFSTIAHPLFLLMKKEVKFIWSDDCRSAFTSLKQLMSSAPVLVFPDYAKPFVLETDASKDGLGAVLSQVQDDTARPQPIAYASRSTRGAESRLPISELEALGVIWALEHFRPYITGQKILVVTDHTALTSVLKSKQPSAKLYRWALKLQEFDLTLVYKPGRLHSVPDALSRVHESDTPSSPSDSVLPCPPSAPMQFMTTIDNIDIYVSPNDRPVAVQSLQESMPTDALDVVSKLQQTDSFVCAMMNYLKSDELPDDEKIAREVFLVGHMFYCSPEGVLYYKSPSDRMPRVFVPSGLHRTKLISEAHSSRWGGHFNARSTINKMQIYYYWPRMNQDVIDQVSQCLRCAIRQGQGRRRRPEMQPIVLEPKPNFCVGMDICQYEVSPSKNYQALVLMDYFTKWPEVYALDNMRAGTIARCVALYISQHSAPRHFITDRGSQFVSKLMKAVCKILQIKQMFTTHYHPQTDGMVERHNRTMQDQLAKCMNLRGNAWDEELPFILLAYRHLPHTSTGESPYFLQRGYDPNPISASIFSLASPPCLTEGGDYVCRMENGLRSAWEEAAHRIARAQEHQKTQHDKTASPVGFVVGDRVWRYLPSVASGPGYKLASPYLGPYIIESVRDAVITVVPPSQFSHLKIPSLRTNAALLTLARPYTGLREFWDGRKLRSLPTPSPLTSSMDDSSTFQVTESKRSSNETRDVQQSSSTQSTNPIQTQHLRNQLSRKPKSAVVNPSNGSSGTSFGLVPTTQFTARQNRGRLCSTCSSRHLGSCPVVRDLVEGSVSSININNICFLSAAVVVAPITVPRSTVVMANSVPSTHLNLEKLMDDFCRRVNTPGCDFDALVSSLSLEERRALFMRDDLPNTLEGGANLPLWTKAQGDMERVQVFTPQTVNFSPDPLRAKLVFPQYTLRDYKLVDKSITKLKSKFGNGQPIAHKDLVHLWPLRIYYSLMTPPVNPACFLLADSEGARDYCDDLLLEMCQLISPNLCIFGLDFEFVGCGKRNTEYHMVPPPEVFGEPGRRYRMRDYMWNNNGGQTVSLVQICPAGGIPIIYSLGDCFVVEKKQDSSKTKNERWIFSFHQRLRQLFKSPRARFVMIGAENDKEAVKNTTGDLLFGSSSQALIPTMMDINAPDDINGLGWESSLCSTDLASGEMNLSSRTAKMFSTDAESTPPQPNYKKPNSRTMFAAKWNLRNKAHMDLLSYSASDALVILSIAYAIALARWSEGKDLSEVQAIMICQATLVPIEFEGFHASFIPLSSYYLVDCDEEYERFTKEYLAPVVELKRVQNDGQWVRSIPKILLNNYFQDLMMKHFLDPIRALYLVRNIAICMMENGYLPDPVGFTYCSGPSHEEPWRRISRALRLGCTRLEETSLSYTKVDRAPERCPGSPASSRNHLMSQHNSLLRSKTQLRMEIGGKVKSDRTVDVVAGRVSHRGSPDVSLSVDRKRSRSPKSRKEPYVDYTLPLKKKKKTPPVTFPPDHPLVRRFPSPVQDSRSSSMMDESWRNEPLPAQSYPITKMNQAEQELVNMGTQLGHAAVTFNLSPLLNDANLRNIKAIVEVGSMLIRAIESGNNSDSHLSSAANLSSFQGTVSQPSLRASSSSQVPQVKRSMNQIYDTDVFTNHPQNRRSKF